MALHLVLLKALLDAPRMRQLSSTEDILEVPSSRCFAFPAVTSVAELTHCQRCHNMTVVDVNIAQIKTHVCFLVPNPHHLLLSPGTGLGKVLQTGQLLHGSDLLTAVLLSDCSQRIRNLNVKADIENSVKTQWVRTFLTFVLLGASLKRQQDLHGHHQNANERELENPQESFYLEHASTISPPSMTMHQSLYWALSQKCPILLSQLFLYLKIVVSTSYLGLVSPPPALLFGNNRIVC